MTLLSITANWYEDPDNGGTYIICGNASGSGWV